MTNFEKAQSKLRSLIWWYEYNMYLTKCIVKAYKRHCKKCPTSEFYYLIITSLQVQLQTA